MAVAGEVGLEAPICDDLPADPSPPPPQCEYLCAKKDGMVGIILGPDLIIKGIRDGSGAMECGLRPGMSVQRVDGEFVDNLDTYLNKVWTGGEWISITIDPAKSTTVMTSSNRLARQAAKQWICYTCDNKNPPYTLACKGCAGENPLRGEADARYRKLTTKQALGEHVTQDEAADLEILHCLLTSTARGDPPGALPSSSSSAANGTAASGAAASGAPKAGQGVLKRVLSAAITRKARGNSGAESLPGSGVPSPVEGGGWSRSEDNRVRELRNRRDAGSEALAPDEEEELRQLEAGFEEFIAAGVGKIRNHPSGSSSVASPVSDIERANSESTWSRQDDNRFRSLRERSSDDPESLTEEEQRTLDALAARYQTFIDEGLQLMKRQQEEASVPSSKPRAASMTTKLSKRLWGGGSAAGPDGANK